MKAWQQFQAQSKAIKRLSYATLGIVIYALFGFFLLPIIVQPILVDTLSEKLDRQTSIESVKINPFALSITIDKLSVSGKHTQQLFGFEQLIINFQALALFKQTIAFDEVSILRPNMALIILESGQYNFDDIIKRFSSAEDSADKNTKPEESEGWSLAIDKFRYIEGNIYFEDKTRTTEFKSKVESISISLDDFSTKPGDDNMHHIQATTRRGTTVDWKGEFSLSPLKSNGHIELLGNLMVASDYLQDQMKVEIKQGKLSIKTEYDFMLSENESKFIINNMLVIISDIDLRRKDDRKVIKWDQISVDLAKLDLINKKIVINKISTNNIAIEIEKNKKSNIDFGDLFVIQNLVAHETEGKAEVKNKKDTGDTENEQPWDITIAKINHENLSVHLVDQSVNPATTHNLQFSTIDISHLRPFTDEKADFMLALKINEKGVINIKGNVKPASKLIDFNLQTNSIALKDYQSYINDSMRIDILSGKFASDLNINIDASKEVANLKVEGNIDISSLTLRDKQLKEKFLSWQQLSIKDLFFQHPKKQVDISKITIKAPYLRLVMNVGGETNIQKLIIKQAAANKNASNKNGDRKDVLPKKEKDAFQATIKNINIRNAKMDFSDNAFNPKFSAGIYDLKGNISGLSSKQLSKAKVDLKGKVDKYAPVTIKGEINPLTQDKFTELEMKFKGIELTTFTPYSGKFAGYKIEKGKISLDLKYKLSKNELSAENGVILDQLTLGEKTDSEDATSLPVNFALSLLKDSNGVIDFDLPIRGNIDDPDFHYGSLVWGALGKLIVGIISSPFKALANLAGGDSESLDYINFSANSAELSAAEKTKLDTLAKALNQRPELYLEIRGVSSSLIDHDEIAYSKVRKKLKLKPAALSTAASENDRDELVDYYETISKLSADNLLPKKHKLTSKQEDQYIFDKALIVILGKTEVTQDEYILLAKKRANKIQQHLIEIGGIPTKNIFLLDSNTQLENEFEDVENASLQLPLGLKAK